MVMSKAKQEPESGVVVTVPWLREQVMELLEQARQADPVDHAVCVRYLDFLFRMLPADDRNVPAQFRPAGQSIRDKIWSEENEQLQASRKYQTETWCDKNDQLQASRKFKTVVDVP